MKIRITASRHSAFYSPLISTMAAGFLEKHGLEFTYGVLPPGETAAGMVRGGKTDVMQSAPSTNWSKMEKGETGFPMHFALINQRDGFFLFGRELSGGKTGFNWKSLEGRTLLADHGSQPLAMLRYAVEHNGATWRKIDAINAGTAGEMLAGFRVGKGDFVHLQAPVPGLMDRAVVSVGASMPANAFSSICAAREFIGSETWRRFAEAFSEAKEWVRQTPAAEVAAKEASYFPGVDPADLELAIGRYQSIGAWDGGIEIPRELYEQSLNVFESVGAIRQRQPYETVCVPITA